MLEKLFTSKVRVEMLKLFVFHPKEAFYVRELTRKLGTEINAVRRELQNLLSLDLLKKWKKGNKLYYQVRTEHPLYKGLLALLSREAGLCSLILENQEKIGDIKFGLVTEDFLRGEKAGPDQPSLLLVGEIHPQILRQFIRKWEEKLEREINYTVLSAEEFSRLKAQRDPFVFNLLLKPRVMIVGDEEELVKT